MNCKIIFLCSQKVNKITHKPRILYKKREMTYTVGTMKTNIHPAYYNATVSCACGNTFQTGSVMKELKIEICNACHPFYTGKEKLLDAAGRVEKFKRKVAGASAALKKIKVGKGLPHA